MFIDLTKDPDHWLAKRTVTLVSLDRLCVKSLLLQHIANDNTQSSARWHAEWKREISSDHKLRVDERRFLCRRRIMPW